MLNEYSVDMESRMQRVIANIAASKKLALPWRRGEVVKQPRFRWNGDSWNTFQPHQAPIVKNHNNANGLSIVSWNIDFMRSYPKERMSSALEYLRRLVEGNASAVIMLNEMLTSDLALIQKQAWIQSNYDMTDISDDFWESGYYGTCMLIPRSLDVLEVFRVHYTNTDMERDALFVDIRIQGKILRLCCTHLESLISDPPKRPLQLCEAAKFMNEAHLHAAILAGDLNAIQSFDKSLHLQNGLKDAYLEYGGGEDDERGMTWGQMAPTHEREKFGLTRMDKILFGGHIHLQHFTTFGHDAVVDNLTDLMHEDGLELPWVTDHLGVRGDFVVQGIPDSNL